MLLCRYKQLSLSPLSMRVQPPSFVTNSPCTYHQLFGIFQQNCAASAAAVNKSIYNQDSSIGVFSLYSFWVCFWLSSIRKSIIECTFKECTNRCVCVCLPGLFAQYREPFSSFFFHFQRRNWHLLEALGLSISAVRIKKWKSDCLFFSCDLREGMRQYGESGGSV